MDPINNQMPTPNPASVPPVTPASPVPPVAPVSPAPVAPSAPVVPGPTAPAAPAAPVAPATETVNPVAQPTPVANEQPAPITVTPGQGVINPAMNSMFVPGNGGLVGATDPITMPAPPKAPDPVEEELKAPFKAAGPVPGSIGSAVSVPADAAVTPEPGRAPNSVAFNDPATMMNNPAPAMPAKKKVSKSTLIALAAVLGVAVIGLAIYLVMTLMSGK